MQTHAAVAAMVQKKLQQRVERPRKSFQLTFLMFGGPSLAGPTARASPSTRISRAIGPCQLAASHSTLLCGTGVRDLFICARNDGHVPFNAESGLGELGP